MTQTTENQATPRPLRIQGGDEYYQVITDGYGLRINIDTRERYEEAEPIARLICKAVNNHDKLVEALKYCQASLDVYINRSNPNSPYKNGKHNCYVIGSKEALNMVEQALKDIGE